MPPVPGELPEVPVLPAPPGPGGMLPPLPPVMLPLPEKPGTPLHGPMTQPLAQRVHPGWQLTAQAPCEQTMLPPHTRPQPPQLELELTSVQTPPQLIEPAGQPVAPGLELLVPAGRSRAQLAVASR